MVGHKSENGFVVPLSECRRVETCCGGFKSLEVGSTGWVLSTGGTAWGGKGGVGGDVCVWGIWCSVKGG